MRINPDVMRTGIGIGNMLVAIFNVEGPVLRKQVASSNSKFQVKIKRLALTVREPDEIMLITAAGQMVRIFVKDIREAGRATQGVKLIDLQEGDKLQAIAPVISEKQEDDAVQQEE